MAGWQPPPSDENIEISPERYRYDGRVVVEEGRRGTTDRVVLRFEPSGVLVFQTAGFHGLVFSNLVTTMMLLPCNRIDFTRLEIPMTLGFEV